MKQLYPFQEAGVAFLAGGGTLLASECGLGKSVQAIEYAKRSGARQILVLCPAMALGVWKAELADQWPECSVIYMADLIRQMKPVIQDPFAVVCSYDLMVKNKQAKAILFGNEWDLLLQDEAQACKNPEARRTQLVYGWGCSGEGGLIRQCKAVRLLSATIMMNHPGELYPHLRALGNRLDGMTYREFVIRYCTRNIRRVSYRGRDGSRRIKEVEQITGAIPERLPELARLMRGFWLPVKTEQVHRQMPPLQVVIRLLPQVMFDARALKKLDASEAADEIRRVLAEGRELREADVHLASLRRAMAMLKVDATVQWVLDLLEEEGVGKVCVWGWHTQALEALRVAFDKAGMRPVLIDGSVPSGKRAGLVAPFQEDPGVRVFIGQIQAAGTAITLTAASRAVFLEQAWVPASNFQSLKRCHRIGSTRPVLAEMLAIEGSIDEAVNDVLARKASEIATLERS